MIQKGWIWPFFLLSVLALLWISKPVLVPLLFAALIAQLLTPLTTKFERRMPSALAAFLAMAVVGITGFLVLGLLSSQAAGLQASLANVEQNINSLLASSATMLEQTFGIAPRSQLEFGSKSFESAARSALETAVLALGSTFSTLATVALVVILAFLMLFYRRHLRRQILLLAGHRDRQTLGEVFQRVSELGQSYVAGLGIVMGTVGILDTAGLLLVRAPFPVLLGVAGALAVLIPYVGIIVVAPSAVALAWATTGSWSVASGVLGVYTLVHLVEGHIVSPYFVGSKVNLNPLATILAIVIGGELWGPAGMVLFIPLAGIAKIVLDTLPELKPLARLFGPIDAEDIQPKVRHRSILPTFIRRTRVKATQDFSATEIANRTSQMVETPAAIDRVTSNSNETRRPVVISKNEL